MKRFALTSLSLALLGTAGVAHAQNSVTLYGVIDTGLTYVHNANGNEKQIGTASGVLSGDRWGLKGQEDLGGGLKAIFQLENGFDVNTGKLNQGGREFGRQAFVGLTSDKLGTVTLGRQYDPLVDMVQGITGDNYWASIVGTPGDVDNYDNSSRVNNGVKYVSANYAGLQCAGLYGFSNGAGTTGQGQTWSGAVAYNNGPLGLAAGYYYTSNPSAGRSATTWNSPSSDSIFDSPINSGYASAHSIGIARAAAQYAIGPVTFGRFLGIHVDGNLQHRQLVRELPADAGSLDRHGLHVRESEWRHGCQVPSSRYRCGLHAVQAYGLLRTWRLPARKRHASYVHHERCWPDGSRRSGSASIDRFVRLRRHEHARNGDRRYPSQVLKPDPARSVSLHGRADSDCG